MNWPFRSKPSPPDVSISMLGKQVLVAITFKDAAGHDIEYFQTHGRIVEVDAVRGIVLEKTDGFLFHLPPNLEWLKPARPGSYRLKATREVLVDPDYLSTTILQSVLPENMARYKAQGFGPFEPRDE